LDIDGHDAILENFYSCPIKL